MDILSLISDLPESSNSSRARLDLSSFWGKPSGTVVFEYKKLSASEIYAAIHRDSQIVKKRYPHFPPELCMSVALIAMSHVSPPSPSDSSMTSGEFYALIADRSDTSELWLAIERGWQRSFPEYLNIDEQIADEKKILMEPSRD